MAPRVVDELKAIEVNIEQANASAGCGQALGQFLAKGVAIRKPG